MDNVKVYWNSRKRMWSLKVDGKIIGHQKELLMTNCTFHVQQGGRLRVIRTGQKNVHAWVKGTVVKDELPSGAGLPMIVYSPHRDFLFTSLGVPIHKAECVAFYSTGQIVRVIPRKGGQHDCRRKNQEERAPPRTQELGRRPEARPRRTRLGDGRS